MSKYSNRRVNCSDDFTGAKIFRINEKKEAAWKI